MDIIKLIIEGRVSVDSEGKHLIFHSVPVQLGTEIRVDLAIEGDDLHIEEKKNGKYVLAQKVQCGVELADAIEANNLAGKDLNPILNKWE